MALTLDDARALRFAMDAAGRTWQATSGDRFCIPDREMDDEVFVVSQMTIDIEQAIGGAIVKFNGTTEWALDSIAASEVLWLPWEHQLREMLGDSFVSLEALPTPAGGFAVTLSSGRRHLHVDAERAYLLAALDVLGG